MWFYWIIVFPDKQIILAKFSNISLTQINITAQASDLERHTYTLLYSYIHSTYVYSNSMLIAYTVIM